jgi:hypothetical protein
MNFEITALTGILLLSALVESLVEYLIRPLVKPWVEGPRPNQPQDTAIDWRGLLLRYVAAVAAIALCTVYRQDILALVGLVSPWPWIGYIVTGFIVGRGANFVHDFAGRWLTPPSG